MLDKRIRFEQLRKLAEECEEWEHEMRGAMGRIEDIVIAERVETSIAKELFEIWKAIEEQWSMLDSVVEKLKAHAGQITVMYRCPFCGCRFKRHEWLYEREENQEVRCGRCGFSIFNK